MELLWNKTSVPCEAAGSLVKLSGNGGKGRRLYSSLSCFSVDDTIVHWEAEFSDWVLPALPISSLENVGVSVVLFNWI